MSGDPRYQELLTLLKQQIEANLARGEPIHIHIWDGKHTAPDASEFLVDDGLLELVSKYGYPVYVRENADGGLDDMLSRYIRKQATSVQVDEFAVSFAKRYTSSPDDEERFSNAVVKYIQMRRTRLIDVDPRRDRSIQLTDEERLQWDRLVQEVANLPSKCLPVLEDAFEASLSPEEKNAAISASRKINTIALDEGTDPDMLDTRKIDAEIVEKIAPHVNKKINNKPLIFIVMYGGLHYSKQQDLDEGVNGISIGFLEEPGGMLDTYNAKGGLHSDTPEIAFYFKEGKAVPLNSHEAQQDFIYGKLSNQVETPKEQGEYGLSPSDLAECKAAVAHLTTYEEEKIPSYPVGVSPLNSRAR